MSSTKKVAKKATKKHTTPTGEKKASVRTPAATPAARSVKSKSAGKSVKSTSKSPAQKVGKTSIPKTSTTASVKPIVSSPTPKRAPTKKSAARKVADKLSTNKRVVQKVSEKSNKASSPDQTTKPVQSHPPRATGAIARAVFREPGSTSPKPIKKPKAAAASSMPNQYSESAENLLIISDPGFLDSSEVHDEADHAQHQQLREQAAIQDRARQMARPETHPDFDGESCVDCDDEIPEYRLKIGRVRCVDCQQIIEDRAKRSGGFQNSTPRFPEDW